MAKHSEQNTTLEQEIPVVIENAPAGQIPAGDIVANPPKPITRTGEISASEATGTQRTRENELGKVVPNNTPMAKPDEVKQAVIVGISGDELVQVKPTKAGPFKIGPKYWRFTVNTVYSVPNYVKQVLSRANALGVI